MCWKVRNPNVDTLHRHKLRQSLVQGGKSTSGWNKNIWCSLSESHLSMIFSYFIRIQKVSLTHTNSLYSLFLSRSLILFRCDQQRFRQVRRLLLLFQPRLSGFGTPLVLLHRYPLPWGECSLRLEKTRWEGNRANGPAAILYLKSRNQYSENAIHTT